MKEYKILAFLLFIVFATPLVVAFSISINDEGIVLCEKSSEENNTDERETDNEEEVDDNEPCLISLGLFSGLYKSEKIIYSSQKKTPSTLFLSIGTPPPQQS